MAKGDDDPRKEVPLYFGILLFGAVELFAYATCRAWECSTWGTVGWMALPLAAAMLIGLIASSE